MLVALAVFVLSTAVATVIAASVIDKGDPGLAGARGPSGPEGPPGADGTDGQGADDETVMEAIEYDPARVAAAIQDSLDPDPSTVQSDLEDLRSAVQSMCSDLSLAEALSSDYISCP